MMQSSLNHPINQIETIFAEHDWSFRRLDPERIALDTQGQNCDYLLIFEWDSQTDILTFCCLSDRLFAHHHQDMFALIIALNQLLPFGFFDFNIDTDQMMFRYSLSTRYLGRIPDEMFKEMVEIGLEQYERFFPLFNACSQGQQGQENLSKIFE